MAYNELIKNFDKIRDYMRDFYVYGFKSRSDYDMKSARSYDDERRRIESWLGDYMGFRQTGEGKNVFLTIDSRTSRHNPLFRAWKAKSFTDGDITLHFILFDILNNPKIKKTVTEICDSIYNNYLCNFSEPMSFDESTVRKKLKEYVEENLIIAEKKGKSVYYSRVPDSKLDCTDALNFFSEVSPCGVIGSFLLDKVEAKDEIFTFKHHYITHTMDSEILYGIFEAIHSKASVTLTNISQRDKRETVIHALPLKVLISVQSGRQYILIYDIQKGNIYTLRIDYIKNIKIENEFPQYDCIQKRGEDLIANAWGVSTNKRRGALEHIEFTLFFEEGEKHIPKRLDREKRCGSVEMLDENHCRFTADVCDSNELVPWMRTFICRITDLKMSNKIVEKVFRDDIEAMNRLYGIEGGDEE